MNDMRVFLTILVGPNPGEAKPLLATEDGQLIALVASWIEERLSPAFLNFERHRGNRVNADGEPIAPVTVCFDATHDFRTGAPAAGEVRDE